MTDTTHPTSHSASAQLQDDAPRRGATPLLWILLVLAVLALAWWLAAQRGLAPRLAGDATPSAAPGTAQPAAPAAAREAAPGRHASAARSRDAGTGTAGANAAATRNAALLAHEQPRYPVAAQRRGVEGTVMLQIAVDANGVPTDIGYAQRSGDPDLDRAALAAARDWRFRPALRDGRAVATTVNVPVRFALPATRG